MSERGILYAKSDDKIKFNSGNEISQNEIDEMDDFPGKTPAARPKLTIFLCAAVHTVL